MAGQNSAAFGRSSGYRMVFCDDSTCEHRSKSLGSLRQLSNRLKHVRLSCRLLVGGPETPESARQLPQVREWDRAPKTATAGWQATGAVGAWQRYLQRLRNRGEP